MLAAIKPRSNRWIIEYGMHKTAGRMSSFNSHEVTTIQEQEWSIRPLPSSESNVEQSQVWMRSSTLQTHYHAILCCHRTKAWSSCHGIRSRTNTFHAWGKERERAEKSERLSTEKCRADNVGVTGGELSSIDLVPAMKTLFRTPIWEAARPTPSSASIVAFIC